MNNEKKPTNITDEQVEQAWSGIKQEISGIFNPFGQVISFMQNYAAANPNWVHTHYRVDFKNRMVLEMRAENGKFSMKDKGYVPKKQKRS